MEVLKNAAICILALLLALTGHVVGKYCGYLKLGGDRILRVQLCSCYNNSSELNDSINKESVCGYSLSHDVPLHLLGFL